MNWRWHIKRILVTAFIALHVATLVIWNMPQSKLRIFAYQYLQYYVLPVGLNQYWAMFAPNPPMAQMRLEALHARRQGNSAIVRISLDGGRFAWQGDVGFSSF